MESAVFEGIGAVQPYVLALCGSSGVCKSSTVDVICTECCVEVIHYGAELWDEDSGEYTNKLLRRHGFQHPTHLAGHASAWRQSNGGSSSVTALFQVDGYSSGRWMTKVRHL